MSKLTQNILKWLTFAESVEMSVVQKVPVASFGPAGNILGIDLLAEEAATTFLQEINAANHAAAPTPAAPVAAQ